MASKTWIATDLELGKLTINRRGSALNIERRYRFLDENEDVLIQIAGNSVLLNMEIADIPPGVLAALQIIDQWTMTKALEQEGMD